MKLRGPETEAEPAEAEAEAEAEDPAAKAATKDAEFFLLKNSGKLLRSILSIPERENQDTFNPPAPTAAAWPEEEAGAAETTTAGAAAVAAAAAGVTEEPKPLIAPPAAAPRSPGDIIGGCKGRGGSMNAPLPPPKPAC